MEGTDHKIRRTTNKQKSQEGPLIGTKQSLRLECWVNVSMGMTSYSPDDRDFNVHSICSSQTTLH